MEFVNKKILTPTFIGVAFLVILVISATYAYFRVDTTNDFKTTTLIAETGEQGIVSLRGTNSNISMQITENDMAKGKGGKTYYASSNGKTETPTEEVIGVASATGSGTFSCSYTLKVDDNTNSMYDAFQGMKDKSEGQLILTVNGVDYDFYEANLFPKEISGTIEEISSTTPQNITAGLRLINSSSIDQSALAGTNITLSFTMESFSCSAVPSKAYTIAYNLNGGVVSGGSDTATLFAMQPLYKVSDATPLAEDLDKGYTITARDAEGKLQTITNEELPYSSEDGIVSIGDGIIFIIYEDVSSDGVTIPKGTYFYSQDGVSVSSFTINSYTGFNGTDTLTFCAVGTFVKVSEATPTESDLAKGWSLSSNTGETITDTDNIMSFQKVPVYDALLSDGITIFYSDVEIEGINVSKGTYFLVENENYITSFTINEYAGFGYSEISNPPMYYNNSEDITLINPKKNGYTFIGWTGSNGDTPELEVTIPKGSTGNKEYTAVWEKSPVTFAIYSEDDNSLRFYYNTDNIVVDEKYNGLTVTTLYEDISLSGYVEVMMPAPWFTDGNKDKIIKVVFEDEDIPITNLTSYFESCSQLTTVENIPKNVSEIGYNAFNWCYNLKSIIIPEGVIRIGESAFNGCQKLESITLPSSLKSIGSYAILVPSNEYISGADGNWYDKSTSQAYTRDTLPTGVAATYVAVKPN